jgi:hypothetical protein
VLTKDFDRLASVRRLRYHQQAGAGN